MFSMKSMTVLSVLLLGCPAGTTLDSGPNSNRTGLPAEGSIEAYGILQFVNSAQATLDVLDEEVRLDSRAAANLEAALRGDDGYKDSADIVFVSIEQLDSVSYVSARAIGKLGAYCEENGWYEGYSLSNGVAFSEDAAESIDDLLQFASMETLAELFGEEIPMDPLTDDSAQNTMQIVWARPYLPSILDDEMRVLDQSSLLALQQWSFTGEYPNISSEEASYLLNTYAEGIVFVSESDELTTYVDFGPFDAMPSADEFEALVTDMGEVHPWSYEANNPWGTYENLDMATEEPYIVYEEDTWSDDEKYKWPAIEALLLKGLRSTTSYHWGDVSEWTGDVEGHVEVWMLGLTSDGHLVGIETAASWT